MKSISTLFLLFVLSGCMGTTSSKQTNHKLDELLNVGATSKASIQKLLGRPDHKEVATSGYECWRYSSGLQKIRSVSHLPVKTIQNIYELKIWVTPQGILMDYEYVLYKS